MNQVLPPLAAAKASALSDVVEARAFLKANPDLRMADALFVDICGRMRGKRLPVSELERLFVEGMQIPYTVYMLDVTGDQHDPCGFGISDGDPDGTAFALRGTLMRAPWAHQPQAQVLMTFNESTDVERSIEPRTILRRVMEKFAPLRLTPVVAFELEFYLLDQKRGEGGRPSPALAPGDRRPAATWDAYSIHELDRFGAFLSACDAAAQIQGLPATTASAELAPGQFEINLRHTNDAVQAADQAALLRHLVSRVAQAQGFDASFMAKPWLDANGSGMHVHLSLHDENGVNLFADGSPAGSALLRQAIGGLQAAMPESMAIFAPDLNAFRRYRPLSFAPVNRQWGINNRSCAFRVPAGPDRARRIEIRAPAACANPYLVLAAILAGVRHGIVNASDPGPPVMGNAGLIRDDGLPHDFWEAIGVLERGTLIASSMGASYLAAYGALKRAEFRKFMNEISAREYEWYL